MVVSLSSRLCCPRRNLIDVLTAPASRRPAPFSRTPTIWPSWLGASTCLRGSTSFRSNPSACWTSADTALSRSTRGTLGSYFAVDPLPTRFVNVLAVGERLPYRSDSFDLVICTQVLCYCRDPFQLVEEIRREVKPGGSLLLSWPAIFPSHAENDRWRFLPSGVHLANVSGVDVAPEAFSVASICRLLAVGVEQYMHDKWPRLASSVAMPFLSRVAAGLTS